MADLFRATEWRKPPADPLTPAVKVRRAVWRAIREADRADFMAPAGPIADKLKMPVVDMVVLWLTECYRLAYCSLPIGETPDFDGMSAERVRAIIAEVETPGDILLGVDGE